MSDKLKILVAGATGQQGGAVARALLDRGNFVRAMSRNINTAAAKALADRGAELYQGDLANAGSFDDAFAGVSGAFLVTTPFEIGVEGEVLQGTNFIDAAKRAGVEHLIFSSVGRANSKTGIPHFDSKAEVETYLEQSGVPYTIVAPVFFMENWLSPWFLPSLQENKVALAMPGDRKLAQISYEDIGRFTAVLFERRQQFLGRRFDISGEALTGEEVAAKLGAHTGGDFSYYQIPLEGIRAQSEDFALMFEWFDKVGYNVDTEGLRNDFPEVGWTNFDDWVKQQDWSTMGIRP